MIRGYEPPVGSAVKPSPVTTVFQWARAICSCQGWEEQGVNTDNTLSARGTLPRGARLLAYTVALFCPRGIVQPHFRILKTAASTDWK